MLGWLTFASIGLNNKPQFLLGFCFSILQMAVDWVYPNFVWIKVVGLHPWFFNKESTKEDCSSYPPWMLHDVPNGVESPLCSLPNLLSLPKDASLHLRKLARHIWTHPVCKTFDSDFEKSSLHPYIRPVIEVFLWPWWISASTVLIILAASLWAYAELRFSVDQSDSLIIKSSVLATCWLVNY